MAFSNIALGLDNVAPLRFFLRTGELEAGIDPTVLVDDASALSETLVFTPGAETFYELIYRNPIPRMMAVAANVAPSVRYWRWRSADSIIHDQTTMVPPITPLISNMTATGSATVEQTLAFDPYLSRADAGSWLEFDSLSGTPSIRVFLPFAKTLAKTAAKPDLIQELRFRAGPLAAPDGITIAVTPVKNGSPVVELRQEIVADDEDTFRVRFGADDIDPDQGVFDLELGFVGRPQTVPGLPPGVFAGSGFLAGCNLRVVYGSDAATVGWDSGFVAFDAGGAEELPGRRPRGRRMRTDALLHRDAQGRVAETEELYSRVDLVGGLRGSEDVWIGRVLEMRGVAGAHLAPDWSWTWEDAQELVEGTGGGCPPIGCPPYRVPGVIKFFDISIYGDPGLR